MDLCLELLQSPALSSSSSLLSLSLSLCQDEELRPLISTSAVSKDFCSATYHGRRAVPGFCRKITESWKNWRISFCQLSSFFASAFAGCFFCILQRPTFLLLFFFRRDWEKKQPLWTHYAQSMHKHTHTHTHTSAETFRIPSPLHAHKTLLKSSCKCIDLHTHTHTHTHTSLLPFLVFVPTLGDLRSGRESRNIYMHHSLENRDQRTTRFLKDINIYIFKKSQTLSL